MKTRFFIALATFSIFTLASAQLSVAQYYDWGPSPASVKWRKLHTDHTKLIYPSDFEAGARRVMWYLDTLRSHIDFGYHRGTMRTPVVLHTQNMQGNGMVMWAPRRIELLAAPSASYSEPWLKQLAVHEYRHNVQYNNLRQGVIRPLTWLLGEQIAFLGVAQFSIFALEGDAVMAETEFSAFGRGLQPSWTMHYRAVEGGTDDGAPTRRKSRQKAAVGSRAYSADYWFCGSFRDYVPNHYQLGYQMSRWSYNHFGRFIWDDIARYVSRNPQWIVPQTVGLRKLYGLGQTGLLRRTFADLNDYWASMPRTGDSSERVATPERSSHTTYRWPQWLNETSIVAFKSDLVSTSRIVRVEVDGKAASGGKTKSRKREKTLTRTGQVSSRPALADGVLWWTEYRHSALWEERTLSRLISYNTSHGRKRTHRSRDQVFYPTPMPAGRMAHVAYDYTGSFSIVCAGERLVLPAGIEVTGLAWDDVTDALYFTGLDDGGMFLGAVRGERGGGCAGFEKLTPSRHISIGDLRAAGGRLYFGSIVSGKDEAHAYDLATGVEYRLSTSTYGSFSPSTPVGGRVALTTYDKTGYHLATQDVSGAAIQERRDLPVDLVNPPWKRWDVPVMDSMVYTASEAARSMREHKQRRFGRLPGIFRPHSWLPVDFYPPAAIPENDLRTNLGATIMSQSLLSDAIAWLSHGWSRSGGGVLHGGISYNGLGPLIDVDFTWGGAPQSLHSSIPRWLTIERKPHLSVTTRLSLPIGVASGRWLATLSPSIEHHYTNGLIFKPLDDRTGRLTRGVERLSFAMRYTAQTRTALSEFQPRWGITARVGHTINPANRDFRTMWAASVGVWLPGVARPHGMLVRAAWQQCGGDANAPFSFQSKEVFPRGAAYNFSTSRWRSGSAEYRFPLLYPEGGIPGWLYIKRVRVNLFADGALWRGFDGGGFLDSLSGSSKGGSNGSWNKLWSYGGELIFDLNPLRLPATNNCIARFTFARPSDLSRGIYFNAKFEMPF